MAAGALSPRHAIPCLGATLGCKLPEDRGLLLPFSACPEAKRRVVTQRHSMDVCLSTNCPCLSAHHPEGHQQRASKCGSHPFTALDRLQSVSH